MLTPPAPREASPPVLAQARPASTPAPPPAQGGQQAGNSPAVFSADQVVHDRERDIVTASGNVQVVQGGR
ncbi:MAG: hypothetical protein FJX21_21050, partial [Alphaproteobacteria bacterium]|nr:hypothetical protein [Alphaproteobacteria bacterium]